MQEIMINLRDSNLETVARAGREMERRDSRDLCYIERDRPEIINTRSRWAPEPESRTSRLAL
eukprot:11382526-Karenia_brevis.AAC.1